MHRFGCHTARLSKNIKVYFFSVLEDIQIMYYIIHYDPTLLHQTNKDNNKVYEKNRPIFTVINVWRKYLQDKRIILPMFIPFNKLFIQI